MPEAPEDLSYLDSIGNEPEPEEEPAGTAPEPEEEPAAEEAEPEEEASTEDDAELEEESAPVRKQSGEVEIQPRKPRAETRIQKLANERAQEREARIRAEAKLEALQQMRQTAPAPDNSEAMRLRQQKLDVMEPLERTVFLQNERLEQIQNNQLLTELRAEDRADKSAYDARAVVDPRYARNKEDVETELRSLRAKGINATREQVLAQVLGKKFLSEKPRKVARDAAARRVESTKGKPTTARTIVAASVGKGDSLSDIESRLTGKSFNEIFGN